MRHQTLLLRAALLTVAPALVLYASEFWERAPGKWSEREVQQLLTDSPWAQQAGAVFLMADQLTPPQPPATLPGAAEAGIAGPKSSAGRWDGGVERPDRNLAPVLTVTVRWESAEPIRQGLERLKMSMPGSEMASKSYIIAVSGLVPAGKYQQPTLSGRSGEEPSAGNPEEMLEGVMSYSRLYPKGKPAIPAEDAKLAQDGTLRVFFPRAQAIELPDKEVTFETRYGSLSVLRKFKLKPMVYHGNLSL